MAEKGLSFEESELRQSKFGLQLKGLLDHIDSTRNGLVAHFQEVRGYEYQMGVVEEQMEAKTKELHGIERSIESGKNRLNYLQLLIQERNEELVAKEQRLLDVERWVGEKEREHDLIEKHIKLGTSKLNWYEKAVEDKSELVESKEMELNDILGSIEKQNVIISFKEEKVIAAQRLVDECDKAMKLKKEELRLIQGSIEESFKTIESKGKVIRQMSEKVQGFSLHKKSLEEWFFNLELKEKQFEYKVKELCLIEKRMNDCLNEVELNEKDFDSLGILLQDCKSHLDLQEMTLQGCSSGLEMRERQLEQRLKELELKQERYDLNRKSTEVYCQNLECTPAKMNVIPSSASNQSCMNRDGRGLQLLMNEHLKRIDLLPREMSAHLQASSDPAGLVLDAIQGFYPSNSAVDNAKFNFDLTVIRRSCVILLQELNRFSTEINPQVREGAIKLASDWKAKMTMAAENSLEILGFLWLVAAFELTFAFNTRELQRLLAIVPEPVHATALCQALRVTDKAPGSTLSFPVKIEEPESLPVRNIATSPSPNVQLSAPTDARNVQEFPDEHLIRNDSVMNEMFQIVRLSRDPGKLVLNLMQKFLNRYWRTGDASFKANLVKFHIPLLKELMKFSHIPRLVGYDVQKDAISLAGQWKAKMSVVTENSSEIFGFLQFISSYGLLSTLGGDEIFKLLEMISQHKQALELYQTLGIADIIPDFVENLIVRKKLIESVRLICTFKLTHKFPPVRLLEKHVEEARVSYCTAWWEKKSQDEKDEVVNDQIADLRTVIQCIKCYNLECEYPSKDLESDIVELEKLKEINWRRSEKFIASKSEQGNEKGKKRGSSSTCSPAVQPPPPEKRQNYKSHLTAIAGSHELSSSSGRYENYGHPGPFDMAAGYHETGTS